MSDVPRWPAALALGASLVGLALSVPFAVDYAAHLDRVLHPMRCGWIPQVGPESTESTCTAAMFSPYAAVFQSRFWGGVPIALFAVGAFSFFAGFALYLLVAGRRASPRAPRFFAVAAATPLVASIVLGILSILKLGHLCKSCVGVYAVSALLAASGLLHKSAVRDAVLDELRGPRRPEFPRFDAWWIPMGWYAALGAAAAVPAVLYLAAMPDHSASVASCGQLDHPLATQRPEVQKAMLHFMTSRSLEPAVIVVDPMCPACKALDQRLSAEGDLDRLDAAIVLFPLDSDCNRMVTDHKHPGSCLVSKAILCAEHRARAVLDWAYDHQDELLEGARAGAGTNNVQAAIRQRWPGLDACMDSKETAARLDRMARFLVHNRLPLSTPQLFVGDRRVCDEDADLGLAYTLERSRSK